MSAARTWLAASVLLTGCSGGSECGVTSDAGDAPLTMSVVGETFAYESFTSSQNNDCPAGGTTVVSVTVGGTQVDTGFPFTLCLPRPDRIDASPLSLADRTMIQVVDVSARGQDGCTYALGVAAPMGTATFAGFCTNVGKAYHLTLAGAVAGTQSCPTDAGAPVQAAVTLGLSGTATVQII